MLSLETRINGVLIGYINVHNEIMADKDNNHIYNVDYYSFGKEPYKLNFKVKHNREEGAEKLLLLIYKEIDKILKKDSSNKKE